MAFRRYFRFGHQRPYYAARWHGLPPSANRRGNIQLSNANMFESSAPRHRAYRPLTPMNALKQHGRASLTAYERGKWERPRMQGTLGNFEEVDQIPVRPSGPEPVDPGQIASWQEAYNLEPGAQPVGGDSDLEIPTTAPTISGGERVVPGITKPVSNQTKILVAAGLGTLAFLYFRK